MRTLLCVFFVLATGLEIQREEPNQGKYGYVTMWINKANAPARIFKHVLSKGETTYLNQAGILESGFPDLNPMGHKGPTKQFVLLEEEGKPKLKQEKQQTPLRPRNSNYQGILDIAQNLRDVGSQYPLVVMTNQEELRDPEVLKANPNLQLVWLNESDFLDRHCKIGAGHELHFQKLGIWKLTQYDKLIWLDTDIAFSNNVDYAFKMDVKDGSRIYGQIDDYHCDGRGWSPTSGGICSGMLLIKPSTLHYQGLMMQQKRMQACWGDQSIISSYFTSKGKQAMQFQKNTINFARCKNQGHMDAWHFSGCPTCKRVGDGDDFFRKDSGQLINKTAMKLKAQAKAQKKKAAEKAKKA